MNIEKKLEKDLRNLGSEPTVIAARLKSLGIKGKKGKSCDCPIARLIKSDWDAEDVSVGRSTIKVDGIKFATPLAIASFISRFDRGDFSDLDEEYKPVVNYPSYRPYSYKYSYNW